MSRKRPQTSSNPLRQAAAVIELAIVLPVLWLIVAGTIEACAMLHLTQSLYITAYEATRVSLIPDSRTEDVKDAADRILKSRNVRNVSIAIEPENFETAPIGTPITVTVSAPANANSIVPALFFRNRTMSGSCSMMKEYE